MLHGRGREGSGLDLKCFPKVPFGAASATGVLQQTFSLDDDDPKANGTGKAWIDVVQSIKAVEKLI